MITEETLKKIIKLNKTKKVLTTKQLNESGLNSYDLKKLVTNNFLERIKRGEYVLKKDNKIDYNALVPLLKNKNYLEAKKLMEAKKILKKNEKILYQLIDIAIRLNSNETLKKRKINVKTISEAIENNNFQAALKIAEKYSEYYKKDKENNGMYIVLKDILNLTNIKPIKVELEEVLNLLTKESVNSNEFKEKLTQYLEYTNNEKYEGLIYALIEVNFVEKSSDFSNIITLLKNIENNNVILKRSFYMKKFRNSIRNQKFDNAEIYLKVVGCLEDIKEEHNIYKYLKQDLDKIMGNADEEKEYIQIFDRELLFLNKVIAKLKARKGIILLNPMDEEKRLRVHEIIKIFPNITSKTIGLENEKRIMLAYVVKSLYPSKSMYDKAREAYESNEDGKAISIYKKIIELGGFEHFIYGNIATTYLRGKRLEAATNYFNVAYYTALEQGADIQEYLHQLETLTQKQDITDLKPYTKIKETDFSESSLDMLDTTNLKDILYLIYEEKYTIENACMTFNLTEEEINLVKLLIAKEEYRNKNDFKADKLMKQVERSKYKNAEVKNLFKEIIQNKLFYRNRPEESLKNLIYVK